jgi:metallophosphoesterase (TIGR00282 family)
VVVNAENAAAGFGITEATARELFDAGADCLTLGNHSWDQKEALTYIVREPRLIRPLNYSAFADAPGRGAQLFETDSGRRVLVINLLGRVHMDSLDDPFGAVDRELEACPLGAAVDAVVVDIHAEATSEKMAMGHFCDGRASLVVGTHTHVPTADGQILSGGTAYQTDAGACADYDSVIGNQKEEPLRRFTTRISGGRFKPAEGPATVCGVFVETDDATGLARRIEPIRVGGRLSQYVPSLEGVSTQG